jgi:hypothetical protein
MTEHDRVGHLHHRCFQVQRQEQAVPLRVGDGLPVELAQLALAHHRRRDDVRCLDLDRILQHGRSAGCVGVLDLERAGARDDGRLLARIEVAAAHVHHTRLRLLAPLAHRVGVRLRVALHRRRHTPIRVAFAQHGIHRAAEHLRVAQLGALLDVVLRLLGIGGHRVTLLLQLLDRRLQLRNRSADVRQLDDVGHRRLREIAELREIVRLALVWLQRLRKRRENPAGEGDVACLDREPHGLRERTHDRQQRVGGERGCLVRSGVDDLGAHEVP